VDLVPTDSNYLVRLAWIEEHRGNLVDATENRRFTTLLADSA
jgi:hypothetical protein